MKAVLKSYVFCPKCHEVMVLHKINGLADSIDCGNPECELFGKQFELPEIELKEKS